MKKVTLIFTIILFAGVGFSQSDSLKYFPGQFSVIYPLGTSGSQSINNKYTVSINMLQGITGAVDGVEIGGLVNINRKYMNGVQYGGIANITGTWIEGGQFAGICNIGGGPVQGGQFAGICNIVGGTVKGGQFAGIANVTPAKLTGVQAAGISNTADTIKGCQMAGISNIATGSAEIQLAGIANVAESVEGVQAAGICNVSGYVKGLQLAGIINICDSIDGIPLAMISIVKIKGYRRFEVSGNEIFHANFSFKIGVPELYTVFSLGYNMEGKEKNTGLGFGIGTHKDIGKSSGIELELYTYNISRYLWMEEDDFMYSLRLNYSYQFNKKLALFVGPTFNVLHSDSDSDVLDIAPAYSIKYNNYNERRYWIGFNAGIRF